MSALSLKVHLNSEEIRQHLFSCTNGHHASYWQIILTLSLSPGKKPEVYSSMLGCSVAKLYRIRSLYNQYGAAFTQQLKWGGRREARCLMSREEEAALLQQHCAPALKGAVLTGRYLQSKIEQQLGQRVSSQYVLNLLHRHGWSKKAPRPLHPKQEDAEGQRQEFKKIPELIQTSNQQGVALWFEDEGSFGRINKLSRSWVPSGSKSRGGQTGDPGAPLLFQCGLSPEWSNLFHVVSLLQHRSHESMVKWVK